MARLLIFVDARQTSLKVRRREDLFPSYERSESNGMKAASGWMLAEASGPFCSDPLRRVLASSRKQPKFVRLSGRTRQVRVRCSSAELAVSVCSKRTQFDIHCTIGWRNGNQEVFWSALRPDTSGSPHGHNFAERFDCRILYRRTVQGSASAASNWHTIDQPEGRASRFCRPSEKGRKTGAG